MVKSHNEIMKNNAFVLMRNSVFFLCLILFKLTVYAQTKTDSYSQALSLNSNFSSANGNRISESLFELQARYGWLYERYEFGPLIELSSVNKGAGYVNDLKIGFYQDIIFNDQNRHTHFNYGSVVKAVYGTKITEDEAQTQILGAGLGAYITYLFYNQTLGFRSEILYLAQSIKAADTETATHGAQGKFFFVIYF